MRSGRSPNWAFGIDTFANCYTRLHFFAQCASLQILTAFYTVKCRVIFWVCWFTRAVPFFLCLDFLVQLRAVDVFYALVMCTINGPIFSMVLWYFFLHIHLADSAERCLVFYAFSVAVHFLAAVVYHVFYAYMSKGAHSAWPD